jgi:hypothetical protein
MLGTSQIVAFAATVDAAKARGFHQGVLVLEFFSEDEYALVFNLAGVGLRIQKVAAFTPQLQTQLGWSVSSIDQVTKAFGAKGEKFEKYPFLQEDENCIWKAPSRARIAWLKDPDGNLLSLTDDETIP